MEVYIAPEVEAVIALHPYLRDAAFRAMPILDQLKMQAMTLHAAHLGGDTRVRMQMASWWPPARGRSLPQLMKAQFGVRDAQLTIAREYRYEDWSSVEVLERLKLSTNFEDALDELMNGQRNNLELILMSQPGLLTERSAFGHQATLLHYIGANGVESHRQVTPLNAPELARLLIRHDAKIEAKARMYVGGQTPFDLASTSAHPRLAVISNELNRVLAGQ